jgi:hypothetical protein
MIASEANLPGEVVAADVGYTPPTMSGTAFFRVTAISDTGKESQVSNEVSQTFDFADRLSTVTIRIIPPGN